MKSNERLEMSRAFTTQLSITEVDGPPWLTPSTNTDCLSYRISKREMVLRNTSRPSTGSVATCLSGVNKVLARHWVIGDLQAMREHALPAHCQSYPDGPTEHVTLVLPAHCKSYPDGATEHATLGVRDDK